MTRLRKMLGTAAAACAATTLLAGAALAGNPHDPGAPTGKPATPPGQAKKGTTGNGSVSKGKALGKAKHAAKLAAKAAAKTHPAHPSHPVNSNRPANPGNPVTPATTVSHKPAFASTKGKGHEKTAHHRVIICHRSGSATNPYVIINVSINAWLNGHTKHPALDGRSDILLKDPASPGEKLDAAQCGASTTTTTTTTVQPATKKVTARPKHRAVAAGGVKGVSSTKPQAAGVLGAISSPVRTANLPFTGFPLWIATLLAALLAGSGLLIRRAARVP